MPLRGDRRSFVAAAMVGVAAVVVVVVAATASLGGGPAPRRTPPPLPPLTTPVPKQPVVGFGFSAADDPPAHQLVLFGGVDSYSTTWLWDGRRWTLARPSASPPGRFGASAAYDPVTHLVMLYGGRLSPGQVVSDTWAWDGTTWRELNDGSGGPPPGEGSVMAWDDVHNTMVLIAGQQTWVWNGALWVRQLKGDLPTGEPVGDVAFDPVTRTLVAITCCAPQVSTFTWNGLSWREVSSNTDAPAIVSLALDPVSDRLLLCSDPARSVVGQQMWSWDGHRWMALAGARLPALPEAEVTDVDDGHVLILDFVVTATQGAPQPIHVWSWSGTAWSQRA